MRVLAVAAVIALAVGTPADAGPRRGRIVRVERPRSAARGTPRICQFNPGDKSANCFGLPPAVGDVGPIVTVDGVAAQARVTSVDVQPSGGPQACTQGLWRATMDVTDSTYANNPNGIPYGGWVIIDVALTASAKIVDAPAKLPSGVTGESAAVSVDKDGETTPDFLVTWYPCQSTTPSSSSQTYCVDYWFGGGGAEWVKQRQDQVTWCM